MQNARLSELEKLLAKSSASPVGRGKSSDLKSSEEFNSLKEENRVVSLMINSSVILWLCVQRILTSFPQCIAMTLCVVDRGRGCHAAPG
jgi:hypothetical protein